MMKKLNEKDMKLILEMMVDDCLAVYKNLPEDERIKLKNFAENALIQMKNVERKKKIIILLDKITS